MTSIQYPYVMAEKHVYLVFDKLGHNPPDVIDKSYVEQVIGTSSNVAKAIDLLCFLKLYDSSDKISKKAGAFQLNQSNVSMGSGSTSMESLVCTSYRPLFDLTENNPWNLDFGSYVTFFRSRKDASDQRSFYQALTFQALAKWVDKRNDEEVVYPFGTFLRSTSRL